MSAIQDVGFCDQLRDLIADHSEWSQATFGKDKNRGPVGALKHLAKEASEAAANPSDIIEYADCLLLLLDATRRAGWKIGDVVNAAERKMEINKNREWQTPSPDAPTEHVPSDQELIDACNLLCEFVGKNLPADYEIALIMRADEAECNLIDIEGDEVEVIGDRGRSTIAEMCVVARERDADLIGHEEE